MAVFTWDLASPSDVPIFIPVNNKIQLLNWIFLITYTNVFLQDSICKWAKPLLRAFKKFYLSIIAKNYYSSAGESSEQNLCEDEF